MESYLLIQNSGTISEFCVSEDRHTSKSELLRWEDLWTPRTCTWTAAINTKTACRWEKQSPWSPGAHAHRSHCHNHHFSAAKAMKGRRCRAPCRRKPCMQVSGIRAFQVSTVTFYSFWASGLASSIYNLSGLGCFVRAFKQVKGKLHFCRN